MDRRARHLSDFTERDELLRAYLEKRPVPNQVNTSGPSSQGYYEKFMAKRNRIPADVNAFPERFLYKPTQMFTEAGDREAMGNWSRGVELLEGAAPGLVRERNAVVGRELQRYMQGGAAHRAGHSRDPDGVVLSNGVLLHATRTPSDSAMLTRRNDLISQVGGGAEANPHVTAAKSLIDAAAARDPFNYTYARAQAAASLFEPLAYSYGGQQAALEAGKRAAEVAIFPSERPRRSPITA